MNTLTRYTDMIELVRPDSLVTCARTFANIVHHGQQYGGLPYLYHLVAVEAVMVRFGVRHQTLRAAAYLHDVLEDTDTTAGELIDTFGVDVWRLVTLVTEPKGGTRKERHAATYPRLAHDQAAITLKLSDRIANVEAGGKTDMYWREHAEFKQALFQPNTLAPNLEMWDYLDRLLNALTFGEK